MATQTRLPTGNGASSSWAATGVATAWEACDDPIGTPDDDTTYAGEVDTNGDQLFTSDPFTVPAGATINSVSVFSRHRREGGTTWVRRAVLRVGGSNFFSGTGTISSTTYVEATSVFVNNPATGLAWTVDQVNGVGTSELQQFGMSITGMAAGDDARITQMYAIADYTEAINQSSRILVRNANA